MLRLAGAIDRFTERTAVAFAWLLVPLMAVVGWEVLARYAFDAPTRWAYETIYMLYAALFMLGAAYALRAGAHVRTDFFSERWSPRTRAAIDVVAYLVLFFPGMALFLVAGWEATAHAWAWKEAALRALEASTPARSSSTTTCRQASRRSSRASTPGLATTP